MQTVHLIYWAFNGKHAFNIFITWKYMTTTRSGKTITPYHKKRKFVTKNRTKKSFFAHTKEYAKEFGISFSKALKSKHSRKIYKAKASKKSLQPVFHFSKNNNIFDSFFSPSSSSRSSRSSSSGSTKRRNKKMNRSRITPSSKANKWDDFMSVSSSSSK